jgi:type I site-specific restriction-modification system R (restriction) subunit
MLIFITQLKKKTEWLNEWMEEAEIKRWLKTIEEEEEETLLSDMNWQHIYEHIQVGIKTKIEWN